jgi:hypothetical protein
MLTIGTVTRISGDQLPRVEIDFIEAGAYALNFWLPAGTEVEINGQLVITKCDNTTEIVSYENLDTFGAAIGKALENLTARSCNTDIIVGVPDDYGAKAARNRPTLIITYREKLGKKWGRSGYTTSIFYPKSDVISRIFDSETLTPPTRSVGNGFAILQLSDDSQLKAFGVTEQGALTTLRWMVNYCNLAPANWEQQATKGTRNGLDIKLLYPRRAEFYPTGYKAAAIPTKSRYF